MCERFALALVMAMTLSCICIIQRLLLLSGDVETNPGPLGQHTEGTFMGPLILSLVETCTILHGTNLLLAIRS